MNYLPILIHFLIYFVVPVALCFGFAAIYKEWKRFMDEQPFNDIEDDQ